jgi:hypothetical protein
MIVLGGFPLDLVCYCQERAFYAWESDDGQNLPAGFKASRQGYVSPSGGLVQTVETTRAGRLDSATLAGLLRSRAHAWQLANGGSYESAVYSVRLTPVDIGAERGKPVSERTASAMTAEIRQIICPDVAPPESTTEALRRIALEVLKAGASTRYADAPEEAARLLAETGLSPESQAATWRSRVTEARKRIK